MNIKSRNDINYLQFVKFSDEIDGKDEIYIADKIIEYFYPSVTENQSLYIELFANALETNDKVKVKYNIDLTFKNAKEWINADTNSTDGNVKDLLEQILKPFYFWQKVDINKISLAEAEYYLNLFISGQVKLGTCTNIFTTRPYRQMLAR